MSSPNPTIAVLGGTGHMGEYVMNALLLPEFRSSYSDIILLTRGSNIDAKVACLEKAGAKVVSYTDDTLLEALRGVDTLVVALSSKGHTTKDKILEILPKTDTSLYIPSEFGVDHDIHDFSAALWDSKRKHAAIAKEAKPGMKICRIYCGLFTEDTFVVPYLGLQASSGKFEAIGSADQKISFTSIADIGKVIASLGTLPLENVPAAIRVASDTISPRTVAELWNEKKDSKISVGEVDLVEFKRSTLAAENVNPGACLRFLQGEGKIDHSKEGMGNDNELVNPGERKWKWRSVADWVDVA